MPIDLSRYVSRYKLKGKEWEKTLDKIGKDARNRGYLTWWELVKIAEWKSTRPINLVGNNNQTVVKNITKYALKMNDDKDDEIKRKIEILILLEGVQIPVASSILAIIHPKKYGVIDVRVWRTLHNEYDSSLFPSKSSASLNSTDFVKYVNYIRKLADKSRLTPREVDMALFQYDKENS